MQFNLEKTIKFLVFLFISFLIIFILRKSVLISINISASLPQHVFLILKNHFIQTKCYVAFIPPINSIYKTNQSFIKIVGGVAGDVVREDRGVFYVNDKRIGYAKPVSSKGIPLTKGKTGVIPKGYYFVYSPHPDSFDSRYAEIGWIPQERVIGRAYPLF